MDSQLVAAIASTVITLIAGILGYAFREYRNRVKPFIAITKIEGSLTKNPTVISIPENIVDPLETTFYINTLSTKDSLGEVSKTNRNVKEVESIAPELLTNIDRIIEAANVDNKTILQSTIPKILENRIYDQWLVILFLGFKYQVQPGDG